MGKQSSKPAQRIRLIEPNLYHIRGEFRVVSGLVNVGTHMSLVKLPSGKFLAIDTIPLEDDIKREIDKLTHNGDNIEAVIATHPFHTLAFPEFFDAYPNAFYYGTPRHLRNLKEISWIGDITNNLSRWESSGVFMRIPDGAEWVDPKPEESNHFNSVWVYVKEAKTIHVDDTLSLYPNPNFVLKKQGFRPNVMCFHPALRTRALVADSESPAKFVAWIERVLEDWDFDNAVLAHKENQMGGAKQALQATLEDYLPALESLVKQFASQDDDSSDGNDREGYEDYKMGVVQGCECG